MLSIAKNTKDELIFKGGTCLFKFYKLNRFSEDIDFTLTKDLDIDLLFQKIISDLALFNITTKVKNKKKVFNSFLTIMQMNGPLYNGKPFSLASVRIDINTKSSIDLNPFNLRLDSIYPDIPAFSLRVMQEKEILAEKVRAILSRTKARDVYDLWFLLTKGVEFDKTLIEKKLSYYNQKWNKAEFKKRLSSNEKIWGIELSPLINTIPEFKTVKNLITSKL